jgi:hypothetical protein
MGKYPEGAVIAHFNPLKQSGYYMYQCLHCPHYEALHYTHSVKLWVAFDSQNKQQLFP